MAANTIDFGTVGIEFYYFKIFGNPVFHMFVLVYLK